MMTSKKLFAIAAFALAAAVPVHAVEPIVVLNENFNDLNLPDWWSINQSTPIGLDWFQGNPGIFAAQAGPAASYIAANYLSAQNGDGTIDNWLLTPALTLLGPSTLSFFTRALLESGFTDTVEVRFSAGSGTSPSDFTTLLATIGGTSDYPGEWQSYALNLDYEGVGRFAFRYIGDAEASNYVGLDTLIVTTVPEPGTYLMFGFGLAALGLLRRKHLL